MDVTIESTQPTTARYEALEPTHRWVLGVVPTDADRRPASQWRAGASETPECECPDFCLLDHDNA